MTAVSLLKGKCQTRTSHGSLAFFTLSSFQLLIKTTPIAWYLCTSTSVQILAMSSNTPAAAALILVPIAIVVAATFIALKTSDLNGGISRSCGAFWRKAFPSNHSHRRRKLRRSNLSSSQTYADSWLDLESDAGDENRVDNFVNQTSIRANTGYIEGTQGIDAASRVWHPSRYARLTWSFANPNSPHHSVLSSVAKPLPAVPRPERLSVEDVESLLDPKRVEAARQ
jgi:hypothetical protein